MLVPWLAYASLILALHWPVTGPILVSYWPNVYLTKAPCCSLHVNPMLDGCQPGAGPMVDLCWSDAGQALLKN